MDGIVLEDPPIVAADLLARRGRAKRGKLRAFIETIKPPGPHPIMVRRDGTAQMPGTVTARGINISVDNDGDVQIAMPHAGCSCCFTVGFISADQADEMAGRLQFAAAEARARKAGAPVAQEGRA